MFSIVLEYWVEDETEGKPLHIDAHFSGQIPVPPRLAQERTDDFLKTHGFPLAFAGTPTLFLGDRLVWRVPVCLPFPNLENEEVIRLGVVDMDALQGDLLRPTPEQMATMRRRALVLAARFPSEMRGALGGATARLAG